MALPDRAGGEEDETHRGSTERQGSVAMARADGDTLAASGAAAAEDRGAAFRLHAGAEAVGLYAAVAIGLKSALGH
jgi:hypothetical protein